MMLPEYEDIQQRIKEEPVWYDQNGVPRYVAFTPRLASNIYVQEVILLKIACQACHVPFLVEVNWEPYTDWGRYWSQSRISFSGRFRRYLRKKYRPWSPVQYGDPPRHDCVGDTMTCYNLKVVEFWSRNKQTYSDWKRISRFEIELEKLGEK